MNRKESVEKLGINGRHGQYESLVAAGRYKIEKAKRTNVLGHDIIVRTPAGREFSVRGKGAAYKSIREDAKRFATKVASKSGSVLVVWSVVA